MSMEMRIEGQSLLVVRIQGVLRRAELDESQRAAAKIISEAGRVSALILLDGFKGWERTGKWGDLKFLMEHDSDIEKIAIVGAERWREEVLMFAGAGLRQSPVRYFNDSAGARAWLADKPSPHTI
jgi:stage II sporulation SpoAA-like protein